MADIAGSLVSNTIYEDVPDNRWNASEVIAPVYEDVPDNRWGAGITIEGIAQEPSRWLMRAVALVGGGTIYWVSLDNPDYLGTFAPETIVVGSAALINTIIN